MSVESLHVEFVEKIARVIELENQLNTTKLQSVTKLLQSSDRMLTQRQKDERLAQMRTELQDNRRTTRHQILERDRELTSAFLNQKENENKLQESNSEKLTIAVNNEENEVLRLKLVDTIAELREEEEVRKSLEERLKEKTAELNTLKQTQNHTDNQLPERYAECRKLTIACMRQLLSKDAEINILKGKLRDSDGQVPDSKELSNEIEKLKGELKVCEESLSRKDIEIFMLKDKLKTAEAKLEARTSDSHKHKETDEIEKLKGQLKVCEESLYRKNTEIFTLKDKLKTAEAKLDAKTSDFYKHKETDEHQIKESNRELKTLQTILKDIEELLRLKNEEIKAITKKEGIARIKRYRISLKLEPSTADPRYLFSSDQRRARWVEEPSEITDNQRQYVGTNVVWGTQGFSSGKHYWEITVEEGTVWSVGVSPKNTKNKKWVRADKEQEYLIVLLWNIAKTSLETRTMGYFVKIVQFPKIGIYLNYDEGKLTFYNIETENVVHEFTGKFDRILYPVFRFFFSTTKNHMLSVS